MATPTSNSIGINTFSKPADDDVAALTQGLKWGGPLGMGLTLTYSIPSGTAYYKDQYGSDEWSSWSALNATEIAHFELALDEYRRIANLDFTQLADNASTVGEIRIAKSGVVDADGAAAWGYYPWTTPEAGDIWLDTDAMTFENGSYDYLTLIHELGHALGLKHPFEPGSDWPTVLPASTDHYSYTIMSYTADPGGDATLYPDRYPTTLMLLDIQAIQYLYGANAGYNAGDSTYTFDGTGDYWQTLWDGGGSDTIVYNSSTGGTIDLRSEHWSKLGNTIVFRDLHGAYVKEVADTVAIAAGTLIENAHGGSGNDRLIGNNAANELRGNSGGDRLYGKGGHDLLYGNAGKDKLYGDNGNDLLNGGSSADTMYGGLGNDTYIVDNVADLAIENAGEGTDLVKSSITFTLSANFENLTLTGASAINGNGNGLANVLRGNDQKNVLRGRSEADELFGNSGNDRLFGDGGKDILNGGKGRDLLLGGSGADTLTGGASADDFRFVKPTQGRDTITDFTSAQGDKVKVVSSNFAGLAAGELMADHFVVNANGIANDADDYFTFSTSKSILFFDADGNGAGARKAIALFSNGVTLMSTDIVILA